MPATVRVTAVPETSAAHGVEHCRKMLVGPGCNEPKPFPGYAGFVGWASPVLLRDGTLLVGFSAGYWHASPPTPFRFAAATVDEYVRIGMPADINAPRGGRGMIIRSADRGRTWTRPETLIDTPLDDRNPNFAELPDGTLLCSFFVYEGPKRTVRTQTMRSRDGGKTWTKPRALPSPFGWDATDGPPVVLSDGSAILTVYGAESHDHLSKIGVFGTTDGGRTWELLSVVRADHHLYEPGIAELPDGRLVMMTRPEGDIAWSENGGRTWSDPVAFGMRMYEVGLLSLGGGTLLCLHGSYNEKGRTGIRAIVSRDGGETWIAPAEDYGFEVDRSVYGYCRGIPLPDGSVLFTYLDSGGHRTEDARAEKIWMMRLRVRPDLSGIEREPATGW